MTDETLTEFLSDADNPDGSIDGPAKLTYIYNPETGLWQADGGEELDGDPDEYRCECSCGKTYNNWGEATRHAKEEH